MAAKFLKSLFGDDGIEDEEYYDNASAAPAKENNKVVSFNESRAKRGSQNISQISLYEPRMYADVKQIASQLLAGRAIVVNFTQMDTKAAGRMVDFLNGAVYAINGEMKRIGKEIFLCAPNNFELSGNLSSNLKAETDSFNN
jgi:cell division inhibitor SepF